MKDIDVFVMYKYGQKIHPYFDKHDIAYMITWGLKYELRSKDLDDIFPKIFEPKTAQIVVALGLIGIQPKTIAEWLDVNQSTVSYHLNKEHVSEYRNKKLMLIRNKTEANRQKIRETQ